MLALDARYRLKRRDGEREVAARAFYRGVYSMALQSDEILVSISIPTSAEGQGYAYEKRKRKVGDYAMAAAVVMLNVRQSLRLGRLAIAMGQGMDYDEYGNLKNASLLVFFCRPRSRHRAGRPTTPPRPRRIIRSAPREWASRRTSAASLGFSNAVNDASRPDPHLHAA
jgi:FAD binding domain in molybdopterin dehydrogenase